VLISLPRAVVPQADQPLKYVAHGQCDARPTVTFPAAGHHRLLTGEKCSINLDKTHACNGHITIIYKKKLHHLASVVPFPLRSVATIT